MKDISEDRIRWKAALINSFHKAFQSAINGFSWEEKAHFLETVIQHVAFIRKGQFEEAALLFDSELLKKLKNKLLNAEKAKLFHHFDKDFAWLVVGIISNETFNSLPSGEQGMTDREYEMFLSDINRYLHNTRYMLYIYESEPEKEYSSLNNIQKATSQEAVESGIILHGEFNLANNATLTNLKKEEEMLDIKQLADFLRCSLVSIHSYKKNGLPFYRVGRKILFKRGEVLEFMRQKTKSRK